MTSAMPSTTNALLLAANKQLSVELNPISAVLARPLEISRRAGAGSFIPGAERTRLREMVAKTKSFSVGLGHLKSLKPNSLAKYQRTWLQLVRYGLQLAPHSIRVVMAMPGSKTTIYVRRATIIYRLRLLLDGAIRRQDHHYQVGDWPAWETAVREGDAIVDLLKLPEISPEVNKGAALHAREQGHPPTWIPRLKQIGSSTGKRQQSGRMPIGWREQVWGSLTDSMYRDAVAVLWLTAARPEELVFGVQVSLSERGLKFLIQGAKIGQHSGQDWREIVVAVAGPAALDFARRAAEAGVLLIGIKRAAGISEAIAAAAKSLWPRRKRVSSYTFRHALASDAKAVGMSRENLAILLGHRVSATSSFYGQAQQGKGRGDAVKVVSVNGARSVKVNHRNGPVVSKNISVGHTTLSGANWPS